MIPVIYNRLKIKILACPIRMVILFTLCCGMTACTAQQSITSSKMQVRLPDQGVLSELPPDLKPPENSAEVSKLAENDITPITPIPSEDRDWADKNEIRLLFDDQKPMTVVVNTMPLPNFIHHVFGDLLQVNYVLDERIKDKEKVSLSLHVPVSERQLFDTVRDILYSYKVTVREKDGIFTIEPVGEKAQLSLGLGGTLSDVPETPGQTRQIIPLKFAGATRLMQIVSAVPGIQALVMPEENALIVTGPRESVEQVIQLLQILDQPAMRGRFGAMVHLKYWDPFELMDKLREILQAEGVPLASSGGGVQGGLNLIPFDCWRYLVLFAAEKNWLDRANYWIKLLDVPQEGDNLRYFVYFPESSRASDLMTTLGGILGLETEQLPKKEKENNNNSMTLFVAPAPTSEGQDKKSEKTSSGKTKSGQNTFYSDDLRMSVDETRNALIFYATPQRYQAVESLIRQLDILPPQVLIEATVAEVTLTDDLQYGLEWFLKSTNNQQTSILQTIGGLGLGSTGLNYSLLADSEKLKMLVNAMAEKELVKVLSSPHITVRDGRQASIVVGTQVPVVTAETASVESTGDTTTGVVRAYQYRETGVSLQVTPIVHAHGVVTLEIAQDVSEPTPSGGENPLILNRTLKTEVVAASGQTVLLGGLIKESKGDRVSQVPFFGDLPILGYFFKNTSRGVDRTELVVMITPHIIRSTQQIDDIRRSVLLNFHQIQIDEAGPD